MFISRRRKKMLLTLEFDFTPYKTTPIRSWINIIFILFSLASNPVVDSGLGWDVKFFFFLTGNLIGGSKASRKKERYELLESQAEFLF